MRARTTIAVGCIGLAATMVSLAAQQEKLGAPPDKHLYGQQPVLREKTLESQIRIEEIPARTVMIRDMTGDYRAHPKVFSQLIETARKYVTLPGVAGPKLPRLVAGDCLGIYPTDADVVNPASLRWQAAIYLNQEQVGDDNSDDNDAGAGPSAHVAQQPTPTQPKLPVLPTVRPAAPYRVTRLPAVRAATLKSDVMHSEFDGMSIYRWMLENGYVQSAPTRMESLTPGHTGDPREIPVRIIIPVIERKSGVKLPANRG
jgi:hypothetical protein